MTRDGRPACPYYREQHFSGRFTLTDHLALCPLWHQDGAEALRKPAPVAPSTDHPHTIHTDGG